MSAGVLHFEQLPDLLPLGLHCLSVQNVPKCNILWLANWRDRPNEKRLRYNRLKLACAQLDKVQP